MFMVSESVLTWQSSICRRFYRMLHLTEKSSLSGGESQRIRLATQIGSALTGVLYVLDEPSIGLHQRDNDKLIATMKRLRDLGNTLIVVEHDEDTMRQADYIVDVGPGAGVHGGEIVAAGSVEDICNAPRSVTGEYLSGRKFVEVPTAHRSGNGKMLTVVKARETTCKTLPWIFPRWQNDLRDRCFRFRQVHAGQ